MAERIQKLIAAAGLASRRGAEDLIRSGRVRLNGRPAVLGDRAEPDDCIEVDGKPLPKTGGVHTLVLYKPRGFVTTRRDEQGRRTVMDLLPPQLSGLYPVGRLDRFSEGLLLMTNDGDLAYRLTHPSHQVEKTYHVWVSGYRAGAEKRLARPIELDGRPIAPPKVCLHWAKDGVAWLEITIHEGRNRQIRRMCQAAGLTVTRLKRVAEGPIRLGELAAGAWRELTAAELALLTAGEDCPPARKEDYP